MTAETLPGSTHPRLDTVLRGLCVVAAIAISGPGLRLISKIWDSSQFLGHGYFIPLVAAYLLFSARTEVRAALRQASCPALGPLVVFGAAALEVLAVFGDVVFVAGIGVPVLLAATCYAIAGPKLLARVGTSLGFLALMVPPPGFVVSRLLLELKLLVTQISVHLLQAGGVAVAAVGNQILVPGHVLFVSNACSGLTSMITLTPLAFIVAYFLSHGIWRRTLVVASIVPIAIGANLLRIVTTVLTVDEWGIDFAQGVLHESFGLVTYVLGTLVLIGVARVLR